MKSKTAVLTAVAALALPAAAHAAKPPEPGKKGRDNAAQKQSANATKKVGFSVSGLIVTGETWPTFVAGSNDTFTFGTVPFELDLTSANKHARAALGFQKSAIEGTGVTELGGFATDDAFRVVLGGITDPEGDGFADDLAAGDRIHIVGKVTRTRNARERGERQTFTYGAVDIRKVVITRGDDDS
jgi:hypothetical protein